MAANLAPITSISARYNVAAADALHVAVASVEGLDVIVSLNMRHIVRLKTRRGVNGINRLSGYHDVEIATPREVLEHGVD